MSEDNKSKVGIWTAAITALASFIIKMIEIIF